MNNSKLKGNLLLLLAAFVWGLSFIAQSKGVELVSPIAFIGIRTMLGAVVLAPVIMIIDSGKKKKGVAVQGWTKELFIGGTLCGIILFAATVLQTYGMIYTSPGKSGFITALYMIFVPLLSLFSSKKPGVAVWISVVIALGGLYLMCMDSSLTVNYGDILTLICALIFSFHIITIDKFSPKVDGVKLSFLQFFVCGILGILYILIFEKPQLKPILDCWVAIGYAGVFSCGVGYTLQIVGQKYTDPTSASILMSLESVFATLSTVVLVALGWQLTGGQLSLREILGCVLMFAAILLVQLPDKKKAD
ncbi:MAG: DMT family transporter [Clostridia bacterium]|nr:DMT family transporter [Clostridia bacterium]